MTKTLRELLNAIPSEQILQIEGDISIEVTAPVVEADFDASEGGVFIARRGLSTDGHQFIPKAITKGAVAIVGEQDIEDCAVPYIQVRDAQQIVGYLAAAYNDFPSRRLIVIGITGTDGKTTTTHLLQSVLNKATQGKAGYISTIAADFGGQSMPTGLHVTTPGAPQVQEYLAKMVEADLEYCVLEMTSHGLAQGRLNGVDLDVAVLTNVTHEHLDYHGSWEAYRDAKAEMFRMLSRSTRKPGQPKIAVLNADDDSHAYFREIPADIFASYSTEHDADYRAENIQYQPDVTTFRLHNNNYRLHLVGAFNVYNALAVIALADRLNIQPSMIQAGIADVTNISGRMERINEGQDFLAIVDFAHTPKALERALDAGRTMVHDNGRLIAVFGSAGLRDVEKRRMMAEVSAQKADITVLTAEDPRTESLDDILDMMAKGSELVGGIEGVSFFRIPDRGEAIFHACQMARKGDVVMVCGKGHEQSMCFGTIEFPWDDRDATRAALRGEPLKTLPTAGGTLS